MPNIMHTPVLMNEQRGKYSSFYSSNVVISHALRNFRNLLPLILVRCEYGSVSLIYHCSAAVSICHRGVLFHASLIMGSVGGVVSCRNSTLGICVAV